LSHLESVCRGIPRGNGAATDTIDAVLARSVVLSNAVLSSVLAKHLDCGNFFPYPMYRGLVVLQLVVDSDTQSVAPSSIDGRSRILAVHKEANLLAGSSGIASAVSDI
jgi:hypothetical protein